MLSLTTDTFHIKHFLHTQPIKWRFYIDIMKAIRKLSMHETFVRCVLQSPDTFSFSRIYRININIHGIKQKLNAQDIKYYYRPYFLTMHHINYTMYSYVSMCGVCVCVISFARYRIYRVKELGLSHRIVTYRIVSSPTVELSFWSLLKSQLNYL